MRHSTNPPAAVNADNPLNKLLRRLEAATSRLEDIASSSGTIEQQANGSISSDSGMPAASSIIPGLSSSKGREASTSTVQPVAPQVPARIEDMDELIKKEVREFLDAGQGLDSLIEEQVSMGQDAANGENTGLMR